VVVHAPTDRGVKGTRFVREAVDRLQDEGVPFEYVQVENLPRAEARVQYERADLIVDQLLAGWYGGVGLEGMALGKPVICYIREQDLRFVPERMRAELPVIRATPATIYEVLREWLTKHRHELTEVGLRGRRYAERWHDPMRIAERVKRNYEAASGGRRPASPIPHNG
jgi:glycosyltransferase involved in cell wall biosynthesis